MGSLMAGWGAAALDPDAARLERNRSLTKDEIESFRRCHGMRKKMSGSSNSQGGRDQHELPRDSSHFLESEGEAAFGSGDHRKPTDRQLLEKSKTYPGVRGGGGAADGSGQGNKTGADWWTRSNWAYLNELPRDDLDKSSQVKYSPQFHVAEMASSTNDEKHASA